MQMLQYSFSIFRMDIYIVTSLYFWMYLISLYLCQDLYPYCDTPSLKMCIVAIDLLYS